MKKSTILKINKKIFMIFKEKKGRWDALAIQIISIAAGLIALAFIMMMLYGFK